MQTAIEKLQEALKLSETILKEPMGIDAADNVRMTVAIHRIHTMIDEALKILSE